MLIGFSFPSIFAILCCLWIPCNINSTQWQHSHWPTSGMVALKATTPSWANSSAHQGAPPGDFRFQAEKMLPDPGFFEVVVTIYPLTPRQDSFGNHSSCGLDRVFGHQVASRNEKMPTTKNNQKLSSLSCRSARSSAGNGISRLCFTAPFLL